MQIKFCKNHPQRTASFRCYYCKDPICSDCRQTLRHHYFCSRLCFFRFYIREFLLRLRKNKLTVIGITQVLLLILIIGQAFYFQHRFSQVDGIKQSAAAEDSLYFSRLSDYLKNNTAFFNQNKNDPGKTQDQYLYTVKLNVQKDWVVNIWNNQRPVISQAVEFGPSQARPLTGSHRIPFSLPLQYGKNRLRILVFNRDQNPVFRDELSVEYRSSRVEALRHSLERGDSRKNLLSLTFDGGSDDAHTREILTILRENGLKCTLFLTGQFMKKHPELVRQMLSDGHEIANHTFNHPRLTTWAQNRRHETLSQVTRFFLHRQLLKTDSIFYQITGQHLKPYWRAPFGEYNRRILTWAAEAGYLHIRWTTGFDTFDWVTDQNSGLYRTPEEIYDHFLREDQQEPEGLNGVIVLMHLGSHRDNNHIYKTLPNLIDTVRNRGYIFGRISDMLGM